VYSIEKNLATLQPVIFFKTQSDSFRRGSQLKAAIIADTLIPGNAA
jgi:hypothetical protein